MGEDRRRRRSGEDLISGLPDELLHGILVRLRSARAAARTSVLSRRWRHVWAHLPGLLLDEPASSLDTVDGGLAGYLAPTLERLSISLSADLDLRIPTGRVAPWLRFAAERVAGELCLFVPLRLLAPGVLVEESELELPAGGRATKITLFLEVAWRLRLQPAGLFSALTWLMIHRGRMEGSELSTLVCTQCPRLSYLSLFVTLVAASNITIRLDSLHSLQFGVMNTRQLELVAPRLEELTISHIIQQAHISAPKLAQLVWHGSGGACDPRYHRFHDVGRSLRRLEVGLNSAFLVQQFDEVDVLRLGFCIPRGTEKYQRFLNEMKRLPKCKTLSISLVWNYHGLAPTVLHLLRSCNCNSTRKLLLNNVFGSVLTCPPSCLCCFKESRRIDGIDLSSLDEVEISSYRHFHEEFEFLELLFGCNVRVLKKLIINYKMFSTPEIKEVCEKVRNMCGPNVKVEFCVSRCTRWETGAF